MPTKERRTSTKGLPELLQRAIDETFASLAKPIAPGDGADVEIAYRKAIIADTDRLESVVLCRWRQLIVEHDPACQKAHAEFWAAVREGYAQCNAELTNAGFNPPGDDVQKWMRLANVIETDPRFTNIGDLTESALTWAERETVRERIRQRVALHTENWSEPMTKRDIAAEVGVTTNKSVNRMITDGRIEIKPHGKLWRYRITGTR